MENYIAFTDLMHKITILLSMMCILHPSMSFTMYWDMFPALWLTLSKRMCILYIKIVRKFNLLIYVYVDHFIPHILICGT